MMIYIGEFRELCIRHPDYPSIIDYFDSDSYPGKDKIVRYLKKSGEVDMMSGAIRKDVITGDTISFTDVGRNDGEYSWWESLAYYVEHYNLRLPKSFEEKILSS